ncbi:1891_t:CDS:2, partial [Rhizophagus irregularis]
AFPKYPSLEKVLVEWIKEKKKNQNAIFWQMVQVKAKLDDFMNYNNLSTYYHITITQHLSDDLIEKQQEFLAFVTYQCIQYEYFLAFI